MHVERAKKLISALERARGHLAMADAQEPGDVFRAEMVSAALALVEALEISNGVVYHGKPAPHERHRPAPGPPGRPPEAA